MARDLTCIRPVRNEDARLAPALTVVILNRLRVGDYDAWTERRQPFRHEIPCLRGAIPLLTLTLYAIHVQGHGHAEEARRQSENGVGAVAVEGGVGAMREQVKSGKKRVRQGVEILVANGRQVLQSNAAVDGLGMPLAAIDRYAVSALRQSRGKLFREGFEAAIVSGDSAGSEKGDAHLHPRGFGGFARGFPMRGAGHFLRRVLGRRAHIQTSSPCIRYPRGSGIESSVA